MSIVNAWDFDINNVKINKLKITKDGKKALYITDALTNEPLRVRFPLWKTYGFSDFEGNKDYKLSMIVTAEDERKTKSRDFLAAIDAKIRETALAHSLEWFGKQKTAESIEEMCSSLLKFPKDKLSKQPDYARDPSFGAKLSKVRDSSPEVYQVELFNHHGMQTYPDPENPERTPHDLTPQYSEVAVVVSMSSIWFVKNEFGLSVRLLQVLVGEQKPNVLGTGKCHLLDFASPPPTSSASSSSSSSSSSFNSFEEEDDGIVVHAEIASLKREREDDKEPSKILSEEEILQQVDESVIDSLLEESSKKSKI